MKNILLGVTGSIAAFKIPELCRLFKKSGFEIKIMLSRNAKEFVGPLALRAINNDEVYSDETLGSHSLLHIDLARWADSILIAPATAHTIAKIAHGMADNLITSVCLASQAPLIFAPAMNRFMWANPATNHNCQILLERGATFLGPDAGEMASLSEGVGVGRLLDPVRIVDYFQMSTQPNPVWEGKKIVITAGPTQEAIDPVRFMSNRSSGKMGYALAQAAREMGARVTLISGPVHEKAPLGVSMVPVQTSIQMAEASLQAAAVADVFIATSAVMDWHVKNPSLQKIKRQEEEGLSIELLPNPDIVATVAKQFPHLFVVAFAAETQDFMKHAQEKLKKKGCQMMVLNDVSRSDIGFDSTDNEVTLLTPTESGEVHSEFLSKRPKKALGEDILSAIYHQYSGSPS